MCWRPEVRRALAVLAVLATITTARVLVAQGSAAPQRAAAPRALDVLDYDLLLDLPDTGAAVEGRATLTVARLADADSLLLDLVELRVDSVLVNGTRVGAVRTPRLIAVPLPPGRGDTLRVMVRYGGRVTDGLIVRADSLGRWTAFGDNWPERARYWIPSVDSPADKATVTWTVIAPSSRRVVANGALAEETPLGAIGGRAPRTLTRWRESRPIPTYAMVIAAAPLAYYDLGRSACGRAVEPGCVRQSAYVVPELRELLPGAFAAGPEIVDWLAQLVGPFPYEKLAHIQSATRFGGMENATAIFYADRAVREGSVDAMLVAHETAHQWFGDAVTERRWADLWLSEGFATYMAQMWRERTEGASAFRASMAALRERVLSAPVVATRPVVDTAQASALALLNANSYEKGAWVLHMLRSQVGDSAFARSLRVYYATFRNGTATTDDFQRVVQQETGAPMQWFFDQWLRRPGWAEVRARWRYDAAARRVVLSVEQGPRFSPRRFPLTVEVRDGTGLSWRATVSVAALRAQEIVLPQRVERQPAALVLDPDVVLLGELTLVGPPGAGGPARGGGEGARGSGAPSPRPRR